MSAVLFLAALIVFVLVALGANVHNGLYWGLALVAAGLLAWTIGLPGWSYRR